MYLSRTSCIICGEQIAKIKYNLKTTYSENSNVLLINFVEKIYKNIFFLHCNICSACYNLLNELDSVQQKEKELLTQLKLYISKLEESNSDSLTRQKDIGDILETDTSLISTSPCGNKDPVISEEVHEIDNIDLKKLPIKVKRILPKNSHDVIEKVPKAKTPSSSKKGLSENEKAFEKIQNSIQLDLSKHVEEHMNKSKPSKNVLCEICGQSFKTRPGYENHLKKHDDVDDEMKLLALNKSSDNNWFCDICGKVFNQKGALARHLAIHTGETRYQCEQCGKKFLHHSSFNMHRKIHAGERNYKCEICNHSFLTNSHLRRHNRSAHNKEKRHSCHICSKKFSENYNLVAHVKAVHKEEEIETETAEQQEEKPAIFYHQVQEEHIPKADSFICIDESSAGLLYSL